MSIKKSFSLIEVLIFVTILSLFLISAATVITFSMHQNTIKVNMLKATHYNEQLLDWLRTQKETDWSIFTRSAGNSTVCFNTEPISSFSNDCSNKLDSGAFNRVAYFTTDNSSGIATQVNVKIITSWQEGGNSYSTQLSGLFTVWE